MQDFYDELAPFYHLIFEDWEASMRRQGEALDAILRTHAVSQPRSVLDIACGIGTQSLPLARLGYTLTASDLSRAAVARASREASERSLSIATSACDMREAFDHHRRTFDAVIACDNAIPHLLSDAEISRALHQLYRCTAPGGLCLVSVRDYEKIPRVTPQLHAHGVRRLGGTRYILFQVWEWEVRGERYETTMYVVEHAEGGRPLTRTMRATYYAIPVPRLMQLMSEAGFVDVERLDDAFYQPVIIGTRLHIASE